VLRLAKPLSESNQRFHSAKVNFTHWERTFYSSKECNKG